MRLERFTLRAALAVGLLLAAGDTSRADDPSTFTGLGNLPGGNFSDANDISADGTVVVGTSDNGSGVEAYRWTSAGGLQGLGALTIGGESEGWGVSPNGMYVVGRDMDGLTGYAEPFAWTSGGGSVSLGNLLTGFDGVGNAATDAGLCVGGIWPSAGDAEAFYWTSGGGQALLPWLASTPESYAYDVSNVGDVIVGSSPGASGPEAVRWTSFAPTGLGDLPGGAFDSVALGCSQDGSVVVGVATDGSGRAAFRWTPGGGMESLETGAWIGVDTVANACSSDGSVIVGRADSDAFLWTAAGGIELIRDRLVADGVTEISGWTLDDATGVSADGKSICGYGGFGGSTQGWVAYLGAATGGGGNVPPPGTIRSFLLPKKAKLVVGPGAGKRTPAPGLKLKAFFDTGPDPVDLSRPATVTIGTKEIAVTGLQAFKNFKWRYTTGELDIKVKTSSYGSSKGRFVMKYTGDLAGDATPDGVLDVIYTTDQFSARGAVVLENGKFTFGRKPGTLIAPEISVRKAKGKLPGVGAHAFKVVAGFTTDGTSPRDAPPCFVAFGDIHNVDIPADAFRPIRAGWVMSGAIPGVKECVLNFAKERVAVRGAKIDIGDVPEGGLPLLLIVTVGEDERAVLVRAARKGKILKY